MQNWYTKVMLISESRKLIFVHNQKTAGASVTSFLKNNVSDVMDILSIHAYASEGINFLGVEKWKEYYSFGFVRNPWSRLASWYTMIVERPEIENALWNYVRNNSTNFDEFLHNCTNAVVTDIGGEKSFLKNQIDYFTDESNVVSVSFIGKFESLEKDFSTVLDAVGISNHDLPVSNTTEKKDYRAFYNEGTKQLVAERFKKDIDYFGYEF